MSDEKMSVVQFDGDELIVVQDRDDAHVVVKRFCEVLGLGYSAQLIKLKSSSWATVSKIDTVDPSGRLRPMACIPLKRLAMWLATIEVNKVAPELRPKLERYQSEAADALYEHFSGKASQQGVEFAALRAELAELRAMRDDDRRRYLAIESSMSKQRLELPMADDSRRAIDAFIRRLAELERLAGDWPELPPWPDKPGAAKRRKRQSAVQRAMTGIRRDLSVNPEMRGYGSKGRSLRTAPCLLVPVIMGILGERQANAMRKLGGIAAMKRAFADNNQTTIDDLLKKAN